MAPGRSVVVVIEDNHATADVLRTLLEASGYTILDARDGEAALQVAAQHVGPIHLLVTDLVLPGVTSSDLMACLADQRPALRVLCTSGYPDGTTALLDRPATRLLLKPFGPDALLRAIREALDEPAAERA